MSLEPGGIIAWIIVGLIAGWMTGKVMKGRGYGAFRDIILGIVGAFIGGFVTSLFGIQGQAGLLGSIVIAFVGATILGLVSEKCGGPEPEIPGEPQPGLPRNMCSWDRRRGDRVGCAQRGMAGR